MDSPSPDAQARRKAFPRGLDQPEKGYRFSMDALLLACFASRASGNGVELGAGCGAASLGLLLRTKDASLIGLDLDPAQAAMAAANAAKLGLEDRFKAVAGDVRDPLPGGLPLQSFAFALANPPFRQPGTGRLSPDPGRRDARFETTGILEDFCKAASLLLGSRASLYLVYLAERTADLAAALSAHNLAPKELLFVHSRAHEPARLVLARAVKLGGPGLRVSPPLFLYHGHGPDTALTAEALAFCPFLECNRAQGQREVNGHEH